MEKFELREDVKIQIPQIDPTAFIADGAKVIGDVIMKANSSIWYNTCLLYTSPSPRDYAASRMPSSA